MLRTFHKNQCFNEAAGLMLKELASMHSQSNQLWETGLPTVTAHMHDFLLDSNSEKNSSVIMLDS